MERRTTMIDVSEPTTLSSGDWVLSYFSYLSRVVVPRHAIEDMGRERTTLYLNALRDGLLGEFEAWLDPLPVVKSWRTQPELSSDMDVLNDNLIVKLAARGFFDLGDHEETEALMKVVTKAPPSSPLEGSILRVMPAVNYYPPPIDAREIELTVSTRPGPLHENAMQAAMRDTVRYGTSMVSLVEEREFEAARLTHEMLDNILRAQMVETPEVITPPAPTALTIETLREANRRMLESLHGGGTPAAWFRPADLRPVITDPGVEPRLRYRLRDALTGPRVMDWRRIYGRPES